jgi:hypothetical protein
MHQRCSLVLLAFQLTTLAACSAHPLPEDFSRKSTFAIVQQIRCEARAGLIEAKLSPADLANTYIGLDFTFDITETNKATSGFLGFTHHAYPHSSGAIVSYPWLNKELSYGASDTGRSVA